MIKRFKAFETIKNMTCQHLMQRQNLLTMYACNANYISLILDILQKNLVIDMEGWLSGRKRRS